MSVLAVLSNLPDEASARTLARAIVEARVAACVNVLAPCNSVYRWEGAIEEAAEVPIVIKTTSERYAELEAFVRARHPYQVPELIALPVTAGMPAYLAWVAEETRAA